jgi:lipopolysaccharide export system protein LptA
MNHKKISTIVLACISILPLTGYGRSDDPRLPLHIESNTAELDDKTGISTYRGKVRITQGSMVLTADLITVNAPGQQLEKITATGKPSTFHQITDDGDEIDAEAEYMEYNTKKNKVILKKKARMMQGKNSFSSERIEYDILTKTVEAGDPKSGDRVKMIIIPDTIKQ